MVRMSGKACLEMVWGEYGGVKGCADMVCRTRIHTNPDDHSEDMLVISILEKWRLLFLSSKAKNAQATEVAQAVKHPGLKGLKPFIKTHSVIHIWTFLRHIVNT